MYWVDSWSGSHWGPGLGSPELCSSSVWSELDTEQQHQQAAPAPRAAAGRSTLSGQVLGGVHGLAPQVVDHGVHRGFVAQENGPNHFVVDDLGAVPGDGRHAPQQEETLEADVDPLQTTGRTQQRGCFLQMDFQDFKIKKNNVLRVGFPSGT